MQSQGVIEVVSYKPHYVYSTPSSIVCSVSDSVSDSEGTKSVLWTSAASDCLIFAKIHSVWYETWLALYWHN